MNINDLIQEGEGLTKYIVNDGIMPEYLSGIEYETWVSKCVLFLEKNFNNSFLTERFKGLVGKKYVTNFNEMLGTLKGIKEIEDVISKPPNHVKNTMFKL